MNPLLTGLVIPTALSAPGMIARTARSIANPFADVLQSALSRNSDEKTASPAEIASPAIGGSAQDPHLALLGELLTGQPQRPGESGIDLADVRPQADRLCDSLERRLQEALSNAGIAGGLDVRLRVNPDDGAVEVVGDHPRRVAIENLFANDPQLSQDFRELAAIQQLLQAADENRDFSSEYAQNPWRAMSRFPELFGDARDALLTFSSTGTEARLDFNAPSMLS